MLWKEGPEAHGRDDRSESVVVWRCPAWAVGAGSTGRYRKAAAAFIIVGLVNVQEPFNIMSSRLLNSTMSRLLVGDF